MFDFNYGRRENIWQQLAARADARFTDGIRALSFQARRTFALWTGIQIPAAEITQVIASAEQG